MVRNAGRVMERLLRSAGWVAVVAGVQGVLGGTPKVIGAGHDGAGPNSSVDSEFRFYAAWYVVGGVQMLRLARHNERDVRDVDVIAAGWLLAALGRVASARSLGRPQPLYVALTAAEFALPPILVGLARRGQSTVRTSAEHKYARR